MLKQTLISEVSFNQEREEAMAKKAEKIEGEIPKGWKKNITPQYIKAQHVVAAHDIPPPNATKIRITEPELVS